MVSSRRLTCISFCLLGLLLLVVNTAAALNVQAVAGRDRIAAGESLNLQLRLDGSPDGDPDLSALKQSWDVLGQSQSSQMQIINGSFSHLVVYSLTLMAKTTGNLMIPAICFDKDCSLPLPITVSGQAQQSGSSNDPLILETEVSSHKIVSQEQLLYKVRLLRRVDLLDGQLNEPKPTGVSAVVKKMGDDRSYETRRGGQRYQVIERNYAIFPQGTGQMRIPALQFDGSIAGGRTRYDPFGQQGRRVRRTSQALQVEVLPLPKDLGRRAWIPATALSLQDDWQQQPPHLTVGEPATRTLRLSATGVPAAQLPELKPSVPAGFKSYPDQPKRDDALAASGITGSVEQKIALVPTRAGHFNLPAIDLDWWDIAAGRWRTAHLAALDIEVAPAPSAGVVPVAPPVVQARPQQVVPGTETASTEAEPARTVSESPAATVPEVKAGYWPWLSLVLALGWLLTLIIFWRSLRSRRAVAEQSSSRASDGKQAAQRSVIQAALGNDARGARQALISWSRALWPEMETGAYERLKQEAVEDLQVAMSLLDTHLYARNEGEWQGAELARLVKEATFDNGAKRGDRLPELYP